MSEAERWKPVQGGLFEASSLGRIKILRYESRHLLRGECVAQSTLVIGYKIVNAKPTSFYVHHLVAEAFLGPRPAGLTINHKDGDRANNRASNLEYVSQKENIRHAARNGWMARADRHYKRKRLSPSQRTPALPHARQRHENEKQISRHMNDLMG